MPEATVTPITPEPPRIVRRKVKHIFSKEELLDQNEALLNAMAALTGINEEFDSVKAKYKARITAAESDINARAAIMRAKFDLRDKDCTVTYRKDRKKEIHVQETGELVATEDMTREDLQLDLIQAESIFDAKEEIQFFVAGEDRGLIVVGRFKEKWYVALRIKIGSHSIQERLDSEQKAFKERFDGIKIAAKKAQEWLNNNFGVDNAKGFIEPMAKAVDAQKERTE
jgi:hypothetical protein